MHVLKPVSWAPSPQVNILSALCWVAAVMLYNPSIREEGRAYMQNFPQNSRKL